jgi:hypothetical protein
MKQSSPYCIAFILLVLAVGNIAESQGQDLYTARGYWQELNKENYRKLKQKQKVGDALTENESLYLQDYEVYLENYYNRMQEEEKVKYAQMKDQWDREALTPKKTQEVTEEFEWRGRDRATNFLYGALYGTSIVVIGDIDNAAAVGIPLIMGGLWNLGPAINPKKYENISRPVLRASNTGKFLGLLYGASLGIAVGGDSEETGNIAFGLATLGSITLGEVGFQLQKKNNYSEGHIELMRHYGVVGPWVTTSALLAFQVENVNLYGVSLLAGGVGGLMIGNNQSKKYDYSKGDYDNISTFTWITTGLGLTTAIQALENETSPALILLPAAGTVLGTLLGQKSVKGVYLTKRQGSTIGYSSAGAAFLGLGVIALTESESPTVWVGVPSALALITQQVLFHRYKNANLVNGLQGRHPRERAFRFSMKFTPENYLINKRISARTLAANPGLSLAQPLVNLRLSF